MEATDQLKAFEQLAAKAARAKLLRYHNHGVIIITLPTPTAAPAPAPAAPAPEALSPSKGLTSAG